MAMIKNKIIYISGILFFSIECHAVDMQVLQEQCADIGFKIKTPANGNCVLQLMQTVKNRENQALAEKREYENRITAENTQRQQEAALRRQQYEMLELQRRQIESQENIAREQRRSAGLQLMQKGLESLSGGNRLRTTCRNAGIGIVTCD
jgi:hypothetical protein